MYDNLTLFKLVSSVFLGKDARKLAEIVSNFDPMSTRAFLPQYKDDFLPNDPVEDLKNKNFHPVPLLIGNTHDEGAYLLTTRNQVVFGPAGMTF